MSNNNVDSYIDSLPDLDIDINSSPEDKEEEVLIDYEGVDPRLKLLSHSSRSLLNKCPRKFQLYRMRATRQTELDDYDQLTFDYGTVVGIAIQDLLKGDSLDDVLLKMFLEWNVDILLRNDKQNKSFYEAVLAAQKFKTILDNGYLQDYELVEYNGKPAVELSFRLLLPNGYWYRGFIDGVLRHKYTGAIVVLEDKTTSYRVVNPAQYKNSGQALGYSIILDHIFPKLSSYSVLYLVYSTPNKEFIELPFEKTALQRAVWLTELLIDTKKIQMYTDYDVFPMNGDFCYDFYRECEYLGLCTLHTENLTKPFSTKEAKELEEAEAETYDFSFDFSDVVESQLMKEE